MGTHGIDGVAQMLKDHEWLIEQANVLLSENTRLMPVDGDLKYYRNHVDALNYQLDLWVTVGNRIMETAFGKPTPLSDSDVCGLIVEQRVIIREKDDRIAQLEAEIAELKAQSQSVIL